MSREPGRREDALQQHRLVRQLVVAVPLARDVPTEDRAHALDTGDGALLELSLLVIPLHLAAYPLPLLLLNTRGDTAVGDDLNGAIGHEHVDEHPVVVRRIPYAELAEKLQRPLTRGKIVPQLGQIE